MVVLTSTSPWAVGMRCWLRVGDLTHGWTMLMQCEEVHFSAAPRTFFFLSAFLSFLCHHRKTMGKNHQYEIHSALETAVSHQYKLKKTASLSAWHFLCSHIFRLITVKKGFHSFKHLFITLRFKVVFLFTSNSRHTHTRACADTLYLVDSQVWALAWYSNKEKAAYNNSHMKCHSSPSCMRYWLLTHSDTRALFSAQKQTSQAGNKFHCPACLMTVFIVNGSFVREQGAGTLWLWDAVRLSCSHSLFICSAQTMPMTTSPWPGALRVLFITIKSAGPNVSTSSLSSMAATPA